MSLGDRMAELRARKALGLAGLDESVPLTRMTSVTNEVWRTPDFVIRLARPGNHRLLREAQVAAVLPPEAGYPEIYRQGHSAGGDVLIVARKPGTALAHLWPELDPDTRRRAVRAVASRMRAIHGTAVPVDLPPVESPDGLACATAGDVAQTNERISRLARLPKADPGLVDDLRAFVAGRADALDPSPPPTFVHGDLHFENVLWDGDDVRAVLDFEYARAGPPDLDLDRILRMCAFPQLHVGDRYVDRTAAEQYHAVPDWLRDAYPELFAHPRLLDRLRVYAVSVEILSALSLGDRAWLGPIDPWHPLGRIEKHLAGTGYLDRWGERW